MCIVLFICFVDACLLNVLDFNLVFGLLYMWRLGMVSSFCMFRFIFWCYRSCLISFVCLYTLFYCFVVCRSGCLCSCHLFPSVCSVFLSLPSFVLALCRWVVLCFLLDHCSSCASLLCTLSYCVLLLLYQLFFFKDAPSLPLHFPHCFLFPTVASLRLS